MNIHIEKLTKRYGDHIALNNINLHLNKGMIGLLGPNGAGKTTLMNILATILPKCTGDVRYGDYRLGKDDQHIRKRLGYLPQKFGLYPDLTGFELLEFVAYVKGLKNKRERTEEIARWLDKLNLTNQKDQKIKTYSGGMKQRIGIAQALIGNPKVVIVDEPSVGLDPEERMRLRDQLTEMSDDRIVLLSTHIVSDIEDCCTYLIVMHQGSVLYAGEPEKLLKRYEGKIWRAIIPIEERLNVPNWIKVIRRKKMKHEIELRMLADECPIAGAEAVEVYLEDVYIALTGGGNA